jgi:hypothetical protein
MSSLVPASGEKTCHIREFSESVVVMSDFPDRPISHESLCFTDSQLEDRSLSPIRHISTYEYGNSFEISP